ncbi:MAG TPA: AAA family ATPase, partial [Sphingomonadales bacterium]|nr:AAA family ATPase [Sphingomonadales bacterium]
IVMTSNLGSNVLATLPEGEDTASVRGEVMTAVRAAFRPEFLNRLDDIILFHRLTRAHMAGIVEIQLRRLEQLLADRKIRLEVTAAAKQRLADEGYDPVYGARPLKRVIQRDLQDPLAEKILEGGVPDGAVLKIDAGPRGLLIGAKAKTKAA